MTLNCTRPNPKFSCHLQVYMSFFPKSTINELLSPGGTSTLSLFFFLHIKSISGRYSKYMHLDLVNTLFLYCYIVIFWETLHPDERFSSIYRNVCTLGMHVLL